jgi:hypothetical protein
MNDALIAVLIRTTAAAARVSAHVAAMQAANDERHRARQAPAYSDQSFVDVITHEGVNYNQIEAEIRRVL